jgi:hypothetical protein
MPAALDKSIAEADNKSEPCGAVPAIADQPKQDQQRWRPPQEESLPTTVHVDSVVPLKSSGEEPLPLLWLHSRPHLPAIEVTVLNTHLTPPSSFVLTSSSMHRQVPGSGAVAPPRKPFALRNGSPASSAMIRVATACPCHPIADADAWHRKHAIPLKRLTPLARGPRGSCFCTHAFELSCFPVAQEYPSSIQDLPHWQARTTDAWPPATLFIHPPPPKLP